MEGTEIIAAIATVALGIIAALFALKWRALKKLGQTFFDAIEDDKVTPDEAKDILKEAKTLFGRKQ